MTILARVSSSLHALPSFQGSLIKIARRTRRLLVTDKFSFEYDTCPLFESVRILDELERLDWRAPG